MFNPEKLSTVPKGAEKEEVVEKEINDKGRIQEQSSEERTKKIVQERIFEILDKSTDEIKKPEKFEIESTVPVEKEKMNHHEEFLSLIEPELKNTKVLDLFCGHNPVKEYFQKKKTNTEVTGIDLVAEEADIKADVKDIEKILPPKKQFDVITDFGGIKEVTNWEAVKDYLKDDGILIGESSNEWFYNHILPVLSNPHRVREKAPDNETLKRLEYFQPMTILEIKNIKAFYLKEPERENSIYIIWKKLKEKRDWGIKAESEIEKAEAEEDGIREAIKEIYANTQEAKEKIKNKEITLDEAKNGVKQKALASSIIAEYLSAHINEIADIAFESETEENYSKILIEKYTDEVRKKMGEKFLKKREPEKEKEGAEEQSDRIMKKQIEFDTDDRSKIVDSIRIAMSDPNLDAKIFKKKIDEGLYFTVFKSAKRFGGGIGFLIEKNGNREAQITFTPEKDSLNMTHREVHSQKFGISGGTLLKTIEEYFRVLAKEVIIPPELKYFSIEAGQVKVIEWVLKNGYQFEKESDAKLFEEIVSGKKNNDYIITDLTKDKLFANYIFEKEVYNQNYEEITKKPSDAKKYCVKFKLKKEIPIKNET